MAHAIIHDFQQATEGEPRAYAGRIYSLHRDRAGADSALGRLKTAIYSAALSGGRLGDMRNLAIVTVVGSLPHAGEEVMHQKIRAVFVDN